jgi:hypothetical protein
VKKNIRNIPEAVKNKVRSLAGKDVVAAHGLQISAQQIRAGALKHLNIKLQRDGLHLPDRIVPPPSQGKYSRRNVEGQEIVRSDLPIETHYHPADTPNWGDSYYGTHTVLLPHKAYPRDFDPPRELEIVFHCPDTTAARTTYVIIAKVDEVLSQASPDFEDRLLEDLNLLQENLGGCGIEAADSSVDEYTRTLNLSWEILPPGSRDEAIERLFRGSRPTEEQQQVAESRYDFFQSLQARSLIRGTSGFRRYFGALLEDDLVVFENIGYGNALYVMFEDWEALSQRSRLELLAGRLGDQFRRIVHREGWQAEVKMLVEEKRQVQLVQQQRAVRKRKSHS